MYLSVSMIPIITRAHTIKHKYINHAVRCVHIYKHMDEMALTVDEFKYNQLFAKNLDVR